MDNNSRKNLEEILRLRYEYRDALEDGDKASALNIFKRLKELYELETGKSLEEVLGNTKVNELMSFLKNDSLQTEFFDEPSTYGKEKDDIVDVESIRMAKYGNNIIDIFQPENTKKHSKKKEEKEIDLRD